MPRVSDEEITKLVKESEREWYHCGGFFDRMLERFARKLLAAVDPGPDVSGGKVEPESETPNREGQWFVMCDRPDDWYGPVERTQDHLRRHQGTGRRGDSGLWNIPESAIQDGTFLRIPPKLDGMDADECRKPTKSEDWYSPDGFLCLKHSGDNASLAFEDTYGGRRWIKKDEPEPKKPWPKRPAEIVHSHIGWEVRGRYENPICVCGTLPKAEAVAHALTMHWRLVEALRTFYSADGVRDWAAVKALITESDAAGFEKPEPQEKRTTP